MLTLFLNWMMDDLYTLPTDSAAVSPALTRRDPFLFLKMGYATESSSDRFDDVSPASGLRIRGKSKGIRENQRG
jgi:hypothetical protein